MGTEVQSKSHVPGYHSMMDINEDSNSSSWSLFYGDKALSNGQYYNGYMPRTVTDGYTGYEKDMVKQKMLEHEAIFKNQVYELHRLYRVQRDMMEEFKRKELYNHHRVSTEASSSSSRLPSQIPLDETRNWHIPSFPLANSSCARQSILGSDVTDSPLSCTKGNSIQTGRVPSQNKFNLKDCSLSESRPLKVRKKLFDLQLPADEYIDTEEGEQIQDAKISEVSSYHLNGDHTVAHENIAKPSLGGKKTDFLRYNSSVSCLRSSNLLADLNEPVQVKEAVGPKSVDFFGRLACGEEFRSLNSYAKPKPQFVDLSEDYPHTSHHASTSENLNNLSAVNKGNRKGWLSYMYEAGNSGRDSNHIPHRYGEQLPISYRQTEYMLDKAHQPPHALRTDSRREELWTERNRSYDISNRSHDHSNYNHKDSVVAPHVSNPCSFVNSSDMTNSWSHSVASWGKPNSTLTQKLTSVKTRPSLMSSETLNRSFQSSAQSHVISGDKWHTNGNCGLNPAMESDLCIRNGFYHGSSSTFKEPSVDLSSVGYDRANHNKLEVIAPKHLINHDSRNVFKGPDVMDLKSRKDLNLNATFPRNSFSEAVPLESLEIINGKRKYEEKPSALPWLIKKPLGKDAVSVTRKDQNVGKLDFFHASSTKWVKNETMKDSNNFYAQNVPSVLNGRNVGNKQEAGDCPSNGKVPGFPIFGKLCMSKNDSSSLVSTSESVHFPSKCDDKRPEKKHRGFDMNVACSLMDDEFDKPVAAEALVVQNGLNTKINNFRNFDLNSCISEDEDQLGSSVASTNAKGKIVFEIDLEAPVVLDTEEAMPPKEEQIQHESPLEPHHLKEQDEVVKIAAEAIVAISLDDQDHHYESTTLTTSETSLLDSLLWLAEAISSSAEDNKRKICKEFGARVGGDIEELDYFEAMTLQLKETKEEDYMPKPFVPEIQGAEEAGGSSLPSRTRKGHARRGRQRRDFQRDILPGLVSLSRHEVTEDIQTFGSLMQATGHQWNGGLTRRNGTRSGAARGRRRCVVDPAPAIAVIPVAAPLTLQPSSIEMGLEDRSLTGWGKTTRRPRRQRCPASNNLAVAFT